LLTEIPASSWIPEEGISTYVTPNRTVIVAKVADFGVSAELILVPELKKKVVDNPVWLAPEILRKECYTEKADIYAFGVILWELMTGNDFTGEALGEQTGHLYAFEDEILKGVRPDLSQNDHACPYPDFKELIREAWDGDPALRPTFDEISSRLRALNHV